MANMSNHGHTRCLRFTNKIPVAVPGAILRPPLKFATPINGEHATQAGARNYVLLFIGAVLFHIAGSWSLPLIDRDEPRFAEASREMRARGDYVVPYFNNQF